MNEYEAEAEKRMMTVEDVLCERVARLEKALAEFLPPLPRRPRVLADDNDPARQVKVTVYLPRDLVDQVQAALIEAQRYDTSGDIDDHWSLAVEGALRTWLLPRP
jgi:hypothetical protein